MLGTKRDGKYILEKDAAPRYERFFDLVVCGLGTAGAEAVTRGASLGLSVLGVERLSGMGGLATLGCVWDYYYGTDGGSWEEADLRIRKLAPEGYTKCQNDPSENRCIPGIVRTRVLEQLARERGAELSFRTVVTGVFIEKGTVKGLRLLQNEVFTDVAAGAVVDCTGDASVCRLAGCRVSYGRAWDGEQMAFSKTIGIINSSQTVRLARGLYTFCGRMTDPDEEAFSNAILRAASMPPCLWEKESSRVVYEGLLPGIREDGHVETLKTATMDDAVRGVRAERPIFHSFMPQDLSNVDRDQAYESELLCDWMVVCSMGRYGFSASVPMEALMPKEVSGLLVAGKPLGADHDLSGGLRMEKDMKKSAEAAADIVYLAKKHRTDLADVPYAELAEMLRETGCMAEKYYVGIADLHEKTANGVRTPVRLPETPEEFRRALSKPHLMPQWAMPNVFKPAETDSVSLAMWAARCLRDANEAVRRPIADALLGFAKTEECGWNFAVALGLMRDERACPLLRELIKHPAPTVPGEYPARLKALCLLGRLGDAEALPDILAIVEDDARSFTNGIPLGGYLRTEGDCVSAALAFSLFACAGICAAHSELKAETGGTLLKWAERDLVCNAGWFCEDCSARLKDIVYRNFR